MLPRFASRTSIDLFCGAGGITEGFRQAGFDCLYANDINPAAVETFRLNHPEVLAECSPVEEIDAASVRRHLGLDRGELTVLVGGPPCQGFSINAPARFLSDPRNRLFRDFIRFLEEFEPKAFLFENVPGMLSIGDGKIFERVVFELHRRGYQVSARVLFAAHYGVPQERWRLILLGARDGEINHPLPTHAAAGRANFRNGRTMTYIEEGRNSTLLPATTVGEAISDLPALEVGEGAEEMAYGRTSHLTAYAREMREGSTWVYNHCAARLSPQNLKRLSYIKPGGSWRDIPFELLPKGMQRARKSDHTRRYGRLRADGLAGTIMTKCDPHWGPVFLPDQDRALTVREAARLQSFPDRYRFLGSRVAQYEQVGNAVPVWMARAVATAIAAHAESGLAPVLRAA